MRIIGMAGVVCALAGCSPGLTGEWQGVLECGTLNWDFTFTLDKDSGKTWLGSGAMEKEYTNVDGNTTFDKIEFDLEASLAKASGAQSVDVTFTCTSDITVVRPPSGGDSQTVSEGCDPLAFRDYQGAWDGEDVFTVAGPDACDGTLSRL